MNRSLSDSLTRFTKILELKEKHPKGYVVWGETDKSTDDYWTRSCVARSMDQNWKVAQKREEQEWANENPRLDNARRMRDTYFILIRDKDWQDAWRIHQPCSSSRRATLTFHLFHDFEPTAEFLDRLPHRSPGLALRTDQSDRRPTDQVADLVVAPKTRTWF